MQSFFRALFCLFLPFSARFSSLKKIILVQEPQMRYNGS